MKISKMNNGEQLTLTLNGRLDVMNAKALEMEIKHSLPEIKQLVIDMENLDYLASAGIRVLTAAQRVMNKQGGMIIRKPNETIREIFEVTGLADSFNIQD